MIIFIKYNYMLPLLCKFPKISMSTAKYLFDTQIFLVFLWFLSAFCLLVY